jgi:apolipoprotein N-acyltransferase
MDDLIAASRQCIEAGAVMVAWPETMVLATMNPGYMDYLRPDADALKYHEQILHHSRTDHACILFGAHAADVGVIDGKLDVVDQYNSAYLYRPDGTADTKRYDKIHLVPFGEYIPFRKSLPWVYKVILSLSPYDYDYNLTPGTEHTLFTIRADERDWNFGVLICYEDTDPTVTRHHTVDTHGRKRADWLVNLSNDGWYVRYKDKKILPTVELAQRTAISVFRSVENRVSIIRSVNTGISCLIEPSGRIRNQFAAGTLPPAAMERQGVAGWFVDSIPIDSRVTVFSRAGRWFDIVVGTGLAVLLGWAVWEAIRKSKFQGE